MSFCLSKYSAKCFNVVSLRTRRIVEASSFITGTSKIAKFVVLTMSASSVKLNQAASVSNNLYMYCVARVVGLWLVDGW